MFDHTTSSSDRPQALSILTPVFFFIETCQSVATEKFTDVNVQTVYNVLL